jgi:hypothetical protein
MGMRIEWMVVMMILVMTGASYLLESRSNASKQTAFAKEFEVYDSQTIEVGKDGVESRLDAVYALRERGELKLSYPVFRSTTTQNLSAQKGRQVGDKIFLDENVSLLQKNGYLYEGEHAVYDKQKEILLVTSPFVAYIDKNVIRGSDLSYDLKNKIATAKTVHAILYTNDE